MCDISGMRYVPAARDMPLGGTTVSRLQIADQGGSKPQPYTYV